MRVELIEQMKLEIERKLKLFLHEENMELYIAANDNRPQNVSLIELERIDDTILAGNRLLFEIKVVLSLRGQPWQSDTLVKGIYDALHPHNITLSELTVLLMSMHVEQEKDYSHRRRKRTVMRYIVEEC